MRTLKRTLTKVTLVIGLIFALALAWIPARALAHGEPVIAVSPDTVAPGGKITLTGDKMGANEEFKITLEGLKFQAELGDAKADADEKFQLQFTIPTDAPQGVYQVKAVGEDGDTVTAELTITAKSTTSAESTEQPMPSAEEDKTPRRRVPNENVGLFVAAVVSALVGLTLVRWK